MKKQLKQPNFDAMSKEEVVSFHLEQMQSMQKEVDQLSEAYDVLVENILKMKRDKFGKKSERNVIKDQLTLFNEVELCASDLVEEEIVSEVSVEEAVVPSKTKRRKRITQESFESLEVVEVIHEVEQLEEGYEQIGQKERKELCYQPAKWYIKHHIYPVYRKELEDASSEIQVAAGSLPLLKKSMATSEVVAHIMSQKYNLGLPLYRVERDFKAQGLTLSRQTMSNWLLDVSEQYIEPLVHRLKEHLLMNDILHADETTLQVLNHQDGSVNETSYMWLYRSGYLDQPIILYDYQPGRGYEYPKAFLKDYRGYLHSDGYAVYQKLEAVVQIGCLAHGRRKLVEALEIIKDKKTLSYAIASELVRQMNYLFKLEKATVKMTLEQKQAYREKDIKEAMDVLKEKLQKAQEDILPHSALGKAINYNLNQFESFERILLDPRLELTNNIAERSIKPFVIGRKNWLFSNTTRGAKSSAMIYSLIQTALENKLNVVKYLTFVFESMKDQTEYTATFIDTLLPISESLPKEIRVNKNI